MCYPQTKDDSIIFVGEDNLHYEKFADGSVKCIEEEIPFDLPEGWAWCRGKICFKGMESKKPFGKYFDYIDIDAIDNKQHIISKTKHILVKEAPSRANRKVENGSVLFSLVRPYLENIAYVDEEHSNCIASTGFYVCNSSGVLSPNYMFILMTSKYVIDGLNQFMKGDNSPAIKKDDIENWLYPIPPLPEQKRIINQINYVLPMVDEIHSSSQTLIECISTAKSKILDLAIRGKLMPQDPNDEPVSVLLERVRAEKEELIKQGKIKRDKKESFIFKGEDNSYYEKEGNKTIDISDEIPFDIPDSWEFIRLEKALDYEQPTEYIVESTEYNNNYPTPVLTAGKSFILGYTNETHGIKVKLPVIIFDDFTTESKYVDFPFKVKSSAMKILTANENLIDVKFAYFAMQMVECDHYDHKRYWISKFSQKIIPLPPVREQKRIVAMIESIYKNMEKSLN